MTQLFSLLNPKCDGIFKAACCILFVIMFTGRNVAAQDKFNVIDKWLQFKNASNSLYNDLADQAFVMLGRRDSTIAKIQSPESWEQRQQNTRKVLMDIVGPFPEKTALNPRITRRIKKEDFTIENIVYESQPGYYVTSSLFIPDGIKDKAPVIIDCIGHTDISYQAPNYQHVILNLVKKGFIVFALDPVGQGERVAYYDTATGKSALGGSTYEHSYPGVQAFITGSSLAMYMIWDGIRAVDYLLTRREVDPGRIGITGISGGGTQSSYIAAFDDRIYAAAPENYITSFTRLLQSIGPQDAEQNMLHAIARGLDHADLLEVRAPKPALMVTTTRDFFSIQGSRETAAEISRVYKAYGKSGNFSMVEDDTTHAFSKKNCEAIYAFFQKHLHNPGDAADLDIPPLPKEELYATSTGQLATSLKGETVFSINSRDAEKLVSKLQNSRKNIASHIPAVLTAARQFSGYREPAVYHEPVFTGRYRENGYALEKYFVQGEGDYVIPYLLMVPDNPNGKVVICLDPSGKSAEASDNNIQWLIGKGFTVMAPDMIGLGELGPGYFRGDSFFDNTSYGVWYLSVLTGRSIVGIRAGDVARLANILRKNAHDGEIYGIAKKEMAPVLIYAAAFDRSISRVALIDTYSSYRSIVMNRMYKPGFIFSAVPGALKAFDLPDVAAALAPGKLLIAGITDGNGQPLSSENAETDISVIRAAYHYKNADQNFDIRYGDAGSRMHDLLEEWIK